MFPCGGRFDIWHSMSHKKGGFVALRHNDLRDLTSKILSELCSDTEIELKPAPLGGKDFNPSRPVSFKRFY